MLKPAAQMLSKEQLADLADKFPTVSLFFLMHIFLSVVICKFFLVFVDDSDSVSNLYVLR